jgi:hypothetical protein
LDVSTCPEQMNGKPGKYWIFGSIYGSRWMLDEFGHATESVEID